MKLKRFLSSVTALAMVVSALSVTSVFAGEPTFTVGAPIDAITGETVTEFKAGQIIEVPVDIENVDSGKIAMAQLGMKYDNTVLSPGIDTTDEGTDGFTYYDMYGESAFAFDPTDEKDGIYKAIYRNNLTASRGTKPDLSGNLYFGDVANKGGNEVRMLWVYAAASPMAIKASEPEFYFCFTVKTDFDAANLGLNYGTQDLTNSGLFALNALYVDETATINHAALQGVQNEAKVNACYGAFTVSVDDAALEAEKIWVTAINADIYSDASKSNKIGTYALEEYVNEDGSTVYAFPTRITSNNNSLESAYVDIIATTNTMEDGSGTVGTKNLGAKTISLTSTVTDYEVAQ